MSKKSNPLSLLAILAAGVGAYFFFEKDGNAQPIGPTPDPSPGPGPGPGPAPGPDPAPAPPPEKPQLLKKGSSGEAVKRWQRLLCSFYDEALSQVHPGDFADGKFGPLTEQYTRGFQEMHNEYSTDKLTVDGVVGPMTSKSMQDYFTTGQDPKGRTYQQAASKGACS